MYKSALGYFTGAASVALAVFLSDGRNGVLVAIGAAVTLGAVGLTLYALGAARLARFFGAWAGKSVRPAQAPAAVSKVDAPAAVFTAVEEDVAKALEGMGTAQLDARQAVAIARRGSVQEFEPMFRAAVAQVAGSRPRSRHARRPK